MSSVLIIFKDEILALKYESTSKRMELIIRKRFEQGLEYFSEGWNCPPSLNDTYLFQKMKYANEIIVNLRMKESDRTKAFQKNQIVKSMDITIFRKPELNLYKLKLKFVNFTLCLYRNNFSTTFK